MSAATGALAWLALLAGAAIALRIGADGVLAAPPLGSAAELSEWIDDHSPQETTMALVRLLAECAVWYLLARSALLLAAAAVRRETYLRAFETVVPRFVQRVLDIGVGAGIVATTLSPAVDLAGAAEAPPTEVGPSGTATMRPVTEAPPTTATARPLVSPTLPDPPITTDGTAPPSEVPAIVPAGTVDVSAGDSFWVLAEETLASAWGRPPTDVEIDPYWRVFVDANRHRLIDPADPDLLVPGQVLEIPEVPPPPT